MRKPLIEDGFTLTVHRVVTADRTWQPAPGARRTGDTTWWRRDGVRSGSVAYEVEIDAEDAGTLILSFLLNGHSVRQAFAILGRPCRFGGYRWLVRCPATGRPAAKLHSCADGLFRTRYVIDAAYRSQDRVPATEKLRDREVAILRRLDADDSSPMPPPKPKWMRQPTYGRLVRELQGLRVAYGLGRMREVHRLTGADLLTNVDIEAEESTAMPRTARLGRSHYGRRV